MHQVRRYLIPTQKEVIMTEQKIPTAVPSHTMEAAQEKAHEVVDTTAQVINAARPRFARITSNEDVKSFIQDNKKFLEGAVAVALVVTDLPAAAAFGAYKGVQAFRSHRQASAAVESV